MAEDLKGEYEESLTIRAPADRVFDFIADVSNLPKYLPTTKDAESQGGERVRVQGEAQGHKYNADGYLRADRAAKRLEWGADEGYYSGRLELRANGEETTATVRVSFRGHPPGSGGHGGPGPEQVREGLRKGLQSIRNQVEGRGGKEEPSAAT
ncbi:MAG: SRPBCC family protein [Acetobacteraceae bacterium]|nr:SRPBCC family protein [Acetobacteraceae bacterium]